MSGYEGHLIDFLDGEKVKTVLVLQEGPKKLQVTDEHGRRSTINTSQVIVLHPATATLDSAAGAIRGTAARIHERHAEIDPELLWETALDSGAAPVTLADAYFAATDSTEQAAVFRALLDDTVRFKRKGLEFTVRTRAQVEEQQAAQEKAEANRTSRANLEQQLKRFAKHRAAADFSPEDAEALQLLEKYLFETHDNEAGKAMTRLHGEEARSAAFRILETAGRIPEGSDPILLVAGLREGFTPEEAALAAALIPFAGGPDREDLTALPACSIDDAETREVDDALTLEETATGWRVGIHIADLAAFVPALSELDILGRRRTISAYMPGGTITMLPPRLSCDLASLTAGELRPAVSLLADFDREHTLTGSRFARTLIRVRRRLDYKEADTLLDTEGEFSPLLRTLHTLTDKLFRTRLAGGAFSIDRPEYKVRLKEGGISITKLDNRLRSQTIVQETMVLYNSLAGSFAMAQGIPVIFRTQARPADKNFPSGQVIAFQPGRMQELFKSLAPAQLSLEPGAHFGLGVEHYIQASSPLRRYADLVMQRQIAAAAAGAAPPYERDDLYRILAAAEAAEKDIRAVERKAIKYWTLEYLRRRPEETHAAVVSRNNGGNCVVELADLPATGVVRSPLKQQPGDALTVRVREAAPARELLVLEAVE